MKTFLGAISPSRFIKATGYAIEGIWAALGDSSFLRLVVAEIVMGCVLAYLIWPATPIAIAIIATAFALPLITEIMNTAIEDVVDMVQPEFHELAKSAKDKAAGATFIATITATILVGLVLWGHFL